VLGLFQQLGAPEVILILAVALLLFGAKKLPEVGKGLGKGLREFKHATKGLADDDEDVKPQAGAAPRKDAADS
jgi:sec-independent protein translocase protein TatA